MSQEISNSAQSSFGRDSLLQVEVLDARRQADGSVVHVASAPLPPGTAVAAEVDWTRRFDLMQQHTGAWQGAA